MKTPSISGNVQAYFNLLFVALSLVVLTPSLGMAQGQFASCNFEPVSFEDFDESNFLHPWDVDNWVGGDISWESTADCGIGGNFTGGEGEAACVRAQFNGPAFDTVLETNEFTLKGQPLQQLDFG